MGTLPAVNLVAKLQHSRFFESGAYRPAYCNAKQRNSETMASKTRYGFVPAISIVVANMIGTGVFTSLGFQLLEITSPFAILMLWALGGAAAFSGAVCYAELGAALKRSGGEYQFLGRIFHPGAGFVSGWVSVSIGFAAPTALAAMTFAAYLTAAISPGAGYVARSAIAIALIVALAAVHSGRRRASGVLQTFFTAIKVTVIAVFCLAAFFIFDDPQPVDFRPQPGDGAVMGSAGFAVALIYVSFAYTGWNAATYLVGEIERPERNLPIILGAGAIIVTALYVALNASFLIAAPVSALAGEIEVGFIAAVSMFGEGAGAWTAAIMAGLLISTVSAMTIAGPRVLHVIGEDYAMFRYLARVNDDGIPRHAILIQSALAIIFIASGSFESVLVLAGSLVALNSFAAVAGLYVLRLREPELPRPYKAFGYPATPAVYLSVTGWALVYTLSSRPAEAIFVFCVLAAGAMLYVFARRNSAAADSNLEDLDGSI